MGASKATICRTIRRYEEGLEENRKIETGQKAEKLFPAIVKRLVKDSFFLLLDQLQLLWMMMRLIFPAKDDSINGNKGFYIGPEEEWSASHLISSSETHSAQFLVPF